jgi:glycosyltransferase involved in cell wall biosynthesis/O-antigen/teichoic acid export membrane protein
LSVVHADAELAIRRGAGWLTLSAVVVGAVNFVYALVLTWLLPVRDYPAFAGSQALLVVCGTAAAASVPWVLSRRIAQGSPPAERRDAITFAVVLTVVHGLASGIAVSIVSSRLSGGVGNAALPVIVGITAFTISAAATSIGYFQGRQQFARIATLQTAEVALKVLAGTALLLAGMGSSGVIAGIGIGALVVVMAGTRPLIAELRLGLQWMKDSQLWRLLLGLTGIQLGMALLTSLDLIMGSLMSRDYGALAGYQVSVVISRAPFFVATSISVAVFARLVSQAGAADEVIRTSLTILLATAVPVSVSIATLPLPVATLFLPQAYPLTVVSLLGFTAPAATLAALTNLLTTLFQAQSRFRSCLALLALGLCVQATGIAFGITEAGVRGLAYAALAGQLITALLLLIQSGRLWGKAVLPRPWLLLPVAASLPLLYFRQAPGLWLSYAVALCAAAGWLALVRSPRLPGNDAEADEIISVPLHRLIGSLPGSPLVIGRWAHRRGSVIGPGIGWGTRLVRGARLGFQGGSRRKATVNSRRIGSAQANGLRILHLAFDDPRRPGSGGGAIRSHEINRRLAKRHQITAVTVKYPRCQERIEDGVRYVQAGLQLGYYGSILTYFAAIPFVVWRHRSDLLVEDFAAPFGSSLARLWTRRPLIAQVQWLAAREKSKQYHLPFSLFERWGVLTHRTMIAVSAGVGEQLQIMNQRTEVTIVPNAVEDSVWSVRTSGNQRRDVVFLGRLEMTGNGLDMLLEAFASIASRTDAALLIAGDGQDNRTIDKRAKDLGLEERVKMLGRVKGIARFELLARAQIACVPSRYESFGLVALEALACATPVLAFDIACLRDLLPKEAAVLVPAFDVARYAEELLGLLANPDRCRTMGEIGRRTARGYDWDEIASQQERVYLRTVGREACAADGALNATT